MTSQGSQNLPVAETGVEFKLCISAPGSPLSQFILVIYICTYTHMHIRVCICIKCVYKSKHRVRQIRQISDQINTE